MTPAHARANASICAAGPDGAGSGVAAGVATGMLGLCAPAGVGIVPSIKSAAHAEVSVRRKGVRCVFMRMVLTAADAFGVVSCAICAMGVIGPLVPPVQALMPRSRRHDGQAQRLRRAEYHSALSPALRSRVREALESLRTLSRWLVARG